MRGFISLLARSLDGQPPDAVARIPNDLLDQLGLSETLGMTRTQGLTAILHRIKTLRGLGGHLMLGVLEVAGRGSGFLRRREASYLPSHGDVHVGERLIRQYRAPNRRRDRRFGAARPPRERAPSLETITTVLGKSTRDPPSSGPSSAGWVRYIPTSSSGSRPPVPGRPILTIPTGSSTCCALWARASGRSSSHRPRPAKRWCCSPSPRA